MEKAKAEPKLRIVVLGAPGVGKSAIIAQFMNKDILERYWFTIELEKHITTVHVQGRPVTVEVVDTPGGYCFQARRRMAIETGDAFILVFSLEDECSFETVAMLRDDILRVKKNEKVPILLVGNKNDIDEEKRITGVRGAQLFAKFEWNTKYVDASAKDKESVTGIFTTILKLAKVNIEVRPDGEGRRRNTWSVVGVMKPTMATPRRHSLTWLEENEK